MNNYIKKICPELIKSVKTQSKDVCSECVVYAFDYNVLKQVANKYDLEYFEYPFIRAIGVKLSQKQIFDFAKKNVVSYIAKQTKVSAQVNISKKILGVKSFYDKEIFGEDVTLAVIDTGINPHIDFCLPQNRIVKFVDLINHRETPYDDNGHGTMVSSIACGSGLASNGKYKGFAPKSKIVAIKALENNGETGAYKILEAMQWISDNYKQYNIRVVCMSFGSSPLGANDPLVVGAESLWNMGIVVVAAAGNSGPETSTIKSPGFSSKIITVGGIDDKRSIEEQDIYLTGQNSAETPSNSEQKTDDDQSNENIEEFDYSKFTIANFSSRGPAGYYFKPDLVAPSVNIVGAGFNAKTGTFYAKMSGTSVATPMIAGICCLIISKYPKISPEQVKIRLLNFCKQISHNKNEEGFGLPNFYRFFDF